MRRFEALDEALELDAADPLSSLRRAFAVPPWPDADGAEWAYFAGNSLGLMPHAARRELDVALGRWSSLAVEAWFEEPDPWLELAGSMRPPLARLVGAAPEEVAVAASLTVNLHLLLASFYRPRGARTRVLIEDSAFPSDSHAVQSHVGWHGLDPRAVVTRVSADGDGLDLGTERLIEAIERDGDALALVLLGAVNYLSGELLDVASITAAAHRVGAIVGWDLAHAVGNVQCALHDADVDFAVWCGYKYLNGGPGAPGGLFVHERHWAEAAPERLAGWWAVDPKERFRMQPDFVPRAGAEGWAISTPPILAYGPLRASLELFDRVGLDALRERSVRLTAWLEELIDDVATTRRIELVTPRDPARRGCQLSVRAADTGAVARRLRAEHGVVCDVREPDVLRFAPVPLYSTFDDCRRAAAGLHAICERR